MEPVNTDSTGVQKAAVVDRPIGYLEVLNRGGRVVHRLPVRHRRIHVGRAYDNDLIVDDPYVCPHHLALQWSDGRLVVTDRESINGIEMSRPAVVGEPATLSCGEQLRIGRTVLRFRSADYPVTPTRVDGRQVAALELFARPLVQVASALLLISLLLLNEYLGTVGDFELIKTVPEVVSLLIAVMVWGMLWAFASRMMLHRWNFWSHCSVVMFGIVLAMLSEELIDYLSFAFGFDNASTGLMIFINYILVGLIIFLNLHFASMASVRRLLIQAVCVSTVIIGLVLLFVFAEKSDFSHQPQYDVALKPPAFRLVGSQTADDFFADSAEMLDEVKEMVAEAEDK